VVSVATGIGTQGQGHFTSLPKIVADQLGVDVNEVDIVTGDTDQFHWGAGTFASRGAVVAGNAIHAAAWPCAARFCAWRSRTGNAAEEHLECWEGGPCSRRGVPGKRHPLGQLAQRANPMRGAVEPGTEPGLEATDYFGPRYGATASGVHAMIVELDPETLDVQILRYVIVHDCGVVINPLILDGQIHGGAAQGIGNAFYEKLSYSPDGQLLSGSFMDYLLPTALDVPPWRLTTSSPPRR
jgi:carbon-monoxide dehydrogenase large subunit